MTEETVSPCEYAQQRHHNMAQWRNLWTILLFAFGTAVVIFLVLAIVFFLREDWSPAAIITVGTMAEGAAVKWVADRRAEAVEEEEKAYQDVGKRCRDTAASDRIRTQYKLVGRFR